MADAIASSSGGMNMAPFLRGFIALLGLCAQVAAAAGYEVRDVQFENGDVTLKGSLYLPAGDAQAPGLVFLHGSGPVTRAGARPYAQEYARLGFASLIFDKRGAGESGGSWVTSSLEDLAADALAAVNFMQTHPRVAPDQIGFWGVSQAGWVAPLAASQSDDIAFMVLISGGGVSPEVSERYSYAREFSHAGLSDDEIRDANAHLDLYFEYLASGKDRQKLIDALTAAQTSNWYPHAQLLRILPSDENRPNWAWVSTWDPMPHIQKLTMPVLLLFGALDTDQPTDLAVKAWTEGLSRAGNERFSIVVFPNAAHGIRVGHHGSGGERPPFADGYHEVMLGWLWRLVSGPTE